MNVVNLYSEFRRTSNSVSRSVSCSGLRDGKFMVGKVQWFYMAKTNHKFPDHANRNYYERDTEFEVEFTVVKFFSFLFACYMFLKRL